MKISVTIAAALCLAATAAGAQTAGLTPRQAQGLAQHGTQTPSTGGAAGLTPPASGGGSATPAAHDRIRGEARADLSPSQATAISAGR